jgi:hypothetical protein
MARDAAASDKSASSAIFLTSSDWVMSSSMFGADGIGRVVRAPVVSLIRILIK